MIRWQFCHGPRDFVLPKSQSICPYALRTAGGKRSETKRASIRKRSNVMLPVVRAAGFKADYKSDSVLRSFVGDILRNYWDRSPTAVTALSIIQGLKATSSPIFFDHLAFRTFGVPGLGIGSIARFFTDFGYQRRDDLRFPAKHVKATWFAPPSTDLPRLFISELEVEQLSPEAQHIIAKYTQQAGNAGQHASFLAASGTSPWGAVERDDFAELASESEYASWTLLNAYNLNHTTISVHRLEGFSGGIKELNEELTQRGIPLSKAGGSLKVSPDGGLLQSSTVADLVGYTFAEGSTCDVSGSYLEFAERLLLPQFRHLPAEQVLEEHRREGFEVGNADKIFESTQISKAMTAA